MIITSVVRYSITTIVLVLVFASYSFCVCGWLSYQPFRTAFQHYSQVSLLRSKEANTKTNKMSFHTQASHFATKNAVPEYGFTNSSNGNEMELRTWELPPNGVRQWEGTNEELRILFDMIPKELSEHLCEMFPPEILINLNEIYLQLGQIPECIVANQENDGKSERSKFDSLLMRLKSRLPSICASSNFSVTYSI